VEQIIADPVWDPAISQLQNPYKKITTFLQTGMAMCITVIKMEISTSVIIKATTGSQPAIKRCLRQGQQHSQPQGQQHNQAKGLHPSRLSAQQHSRLKGLQLNLRLRVALTVMCKCVTGQAIALIILTSRRTGLLLSDLQQGLPPDLPAVVVREKDNHLLFL
jgi:hypothetical protein